MATDDVYQPHTGHKSTMTILHILERSESWPVAAKKVRNSAVVGIRIFLESELVERLIVETTVMFLDHLCLLL
jgi:hypothetical protein